MTSLPVSFSEKIKASQSGGGGYPVQISAKDLDKNFVYCLLDAPEVDEAGNPQPFVVSEKSGQGGHQQRQIIFNPPPPLDGESYRLSFENGAWTWTPPDIPDGTAQGQLLMWDMTAMAYVLITPTEPGQLLQWDATAGSWALLTPSSPGQLLQWDATAGSWVFVTPSVLGQILQWDSQSWSFITPSAKSILYFDGSTWNFFQAGEPTQYLTGDFTLGQFCADVESCMQETIDGLAARITSLEGSGGLGIPAVPATGTYVLGAVDGTIKWIATEAC